MRPPARLGTGVGSALLGPLRTAVRVRGGESLIVASDPNARGFYEKHGAVYVGEAASSPRPRTIPVFELDLRD